MIDKKIFWLARKMVDSLKFHAKKLRYNFIVKKDQKKDTLSFSFFTFRLVFFQTIKSALISCILLCGDLLLIPLIAEKRNIAIPQMDTGLGIDIVLGCMGVAGVILGLYCSNITSIYATKYANAPQNIATLFQQDIISNRCIKQIVSYIILCIIFLILFLFDIDILYLSIAFTLVQTIHIVVLFSAAGNRSNILSNTYQISHSIYSKIISIFKKISRNNVLACDKSFQNYFQRNCASHLQNLYDIAIFNKDNPSNQNASALSFMNSNISLLELYWLDKYEIRYDSLWYRDRPKYQQWHFASDASVELALKTGRSLQPETQRDYWWVEDEIERINTVCFQKLCRDQDHISILNYLNSVAALSSKAIYSGNILMWAKSVRRLQIQFMTMQSDQNISDNKLIPAIYDGFVSIYINIIVGINSYLHDLDLHGFFEKVCIINSFESCNHALCNNETVDRLFRQIRVEIKLEGKQITPNWYVKQVVSKGIIHFFNELLNCISTSISDCLDMGKQLIEKRKYFPAAVSFSHMYELNSKIEYSISCIDYYYSQIEKLLLEPTIVVEDIELSEAKKILASVKKELPQLLVKCSGIFAIQHWNEREEYPDLLGFCYNHICESLIESIEQNDFETFSKTYTGFLGVVLLYQEYVRVDATKIKEPHLQQGVFHVSTAPIIEYAIISSLSILWGEFNKSTQWMELINQELDNFIQKNENAIDSLTRISTIAAARKRHMAAIGNRDVLQTGWTMRIVNALEEAKVCDFDYGPFGQKILKTDSKILKAFYGTYFSGLEYTHHVEDIYFVCCVNKYLSKDDLYKGDFEWEEDFDADGNC